MMNMDVTFAYLTVCLCKIELANLTNCAIMTDTALAILRISFISIDKNRDSVPLDPGDDLLAL